MIIYGTKATLRKTDFIADACPACGAGNVMQMNVFQRYAHVYWIPFFPIGKTGVSQCTNCKQVLKFDQMTPSLKMSYYNIKKHTAIPVWTFSGVFIIALIAVGVTISSRQTAKKVSSMITSLKKDDILQIKLKDNAYTLIKVNRVVGDSIYCVANKYQTNLESDIDNLKSKEFETEEDGISTADLKLMDKKEQILDVERN
ncbi:hypothetical protein [Mucilaginibacter sp. OK283]|jgi:hypothetical protein|uniref:hypothetical protein n=1 Tax=Mucilaginibacter sp. OK283 TaxID=1881049 RepID=UPI0008B2265F|nr:hypothetical protein [Mucilaginibacter sp. OK283]SEO84086.1 hypothetical protein SAMN05428947_104289 [Mucilaginibacter sp. OK283]